MTVLIHMGRRLPRNWLRRTGSKVKGLLSFQQNIWMIISQSMNLAKKKANASKKLLFKITKDNEIEDLNYEIEWLKIMIQGTKEQEKEEYDESMMMYQTLGNVMKKEIPKDENLSRHFKTKVLSTAKVDEAYKKGYGAMSSSNIANKLLEMGILTHIELIEDYETRPVEYKPDF